MSKNCEYIKEKIINAIINAYVNKVLYSYNTTVRAYNIKIAFLIRTSIQKCYLFVV